MPRIPDLRRIVQDNIEREGQHLFAIFPDDDDPGFAYTIGNATAGLPELLIIGNFAPHTSASILNDLGKRMRETGLPLAGDISLGGRFPIRVREAGPSAKWRYTLQVGRYLGHQTYDVLQVLLCDPDGRYPGEPGCDPDYDVPLV